MLRIAHGAGKVFLGVRLVRGKAFLGVSAGRSVLRWGLLGCPDLCGGVLGVVLGPSRRRPGRRGVRAGAVLARGGPSWGLPAAQGAVEAYLQAAQEGVMQTVT